ncbi:hypothetical protein B4U79_11974, partial [Dinothrombium tinctorium]
DAHTFDLTEFKAEEGRYRSISVFTMLDPKGQQLPYTSRDFLSRPPNLKIALIYDAVDLFVKAFDELNSQQKISKPSMRCDSTEPWTFGEMIVNYMKKVIITQNKGFTGLIEFDEYGQRTNITLDVIEFRNISYEKKSNHSTYQRMWSFMESRIPSVFVGQDKGVARTLKGDYAYLMESSSIEYMIHKYPCDLTTVGGLLDQKEYGIALRQESPYQSFFSRLILKYEEAGVLRELKKKWFNEKVEPFQGRKCEVAKKQETSAIELHIGQLAGVFIVLIGGTGFGCLIVIIEFIWKTKKVARHERVS